MSPGLHETFASLCGEGGRYQNSWSARSPDGRTVAVTVWRRDIVGDEVNMFGKMKRQPPNAAGRERIENLLWAKDHCGDLFRVVVIEARDPEATVKKIKQVVGVDPLPWRLVTINPDTGEYIARRLTELEEHLGEVPEQARGQSATPSCG
jgi:hypothetical protein